MSNLIQTFIKKHELTQPKLGELLGVHHSQISLLSSGRRRFRPLYRLALEALDRRLRAKRLKHQPRSSPCPQCGSPTRLRNSDLAHWHRHWFHGHLRGYARCEGCRISMGLLSKGTWQRLDRGVNPNTGMEVVLTRKHVSKKSRYEKDFGFVWCDESVGRIDGCGGLCAPYGKYTFHARRVSTGTVFHIFKCNNPKCQYYAKRLKCRGGKAADSIPNTQRRTTLPKKARVCPYCKGPTICKAKAGVTTGQIQVVCKACKRISYFVPKRGRFTIPQGRPRSLFGVES